MFGITGFKLMIILIAGLILIGPDKMPEIARTIGKFVRMFNAAKDDMERMIKADMFASENPTAASIADDKTAASAETSDTVASTLYEIDEDEEEEEE